MEPQTTPHRTLNKLANWVNDAPTIEISAQRYDQIIHGNLPTPVASPFAAKLPGFRH